MSKHSVTILIIDDNAEARADLTRLLNGDTSSEYRILEAADTAQAVRICLESSPDYVLLDVESPEEAASFLAAVNPDAQNPQTPVILLAKPADEAEVRKLSRRAATTYLLKNQFSADELHRAARRAMETARRETNDELRASQLQTYLALEAANTVAFTWDIETDVVQRLYSGVEAFPKTVDDTLADIVARVLESDRERFLENLKTALANPDQTYRAEYRVVQPDGKITWLNEIGRFVMDENGRAIRLTGILTDITERKIVEEQLRASEARLHLGVEVADFAISQIDYTTGMFHLSKEAARLFGLGRKEITVPREAVHETFHPADAPEIMRSIAEALIPEGEGSFALEHRIVRKNGDVRWINVRKQIVFDHTQNPPRPTIGILVAQDITERKEIAEKLAETAYSLTREREQLAVALRTGQFGAYEWNVVEHTLWWSPETFHLLGVDPETFTPNAETFGALVHPDDYEELWRKSEESVARREVFTHEYRIIRPDGAVRWIYNRSHVSLNEEGEVERVTGIVQDITERKQADEKIRQSEERYRALVKATAQVEWIAAPDGSFNAPQPTWEEFTGQSFEEYRNSGWNTTLHPDDRTRTLEAWQKAVREKSLYEIENRMRRRDGAYRWMQVRAVPILDAQGEIIEWIGANTDITERKEAEEEIRQNEKRFHQLANSLPQLVWTCEPDGPCDFLSRQWIDYTGIPEKEQLGFGWLDQLHPDDRQPTINAWNKAVEEGTNFQAVFRIRRHDGVYRPFDTRAVRLLDDEGKTVKWFGSNTDVTERQEAEKALRVSHNTFRHLVENSPFGIFVVDADFRLSLVGAGAQKFFENVRPLIGRDFAELLRVVWTEPFAGEAVTLFRRTLETGDPYHAPNTVERRADTGEIESYDWKIERMTMPDGRFGVVCHFYDLSERQRYEARMRESEERFRLASDAGAALVYDADLTGSRQTIVYGLERVTGYQTNETDLSGEWWHSLIHEEDLPAHLEKHHRHLEKGGSLRSVYRVRHKNGGWIWVEDTAQVVKDADGKSLQLVGAIVDISERKKAEQELAVQRRLYKSITDNATTALFIMDEKQQCAFMNPAAEKLTGYTLQETLGRPLHDVVHHTHPDGTPYPLSECPIDQAFPTRNQMQGEEVFVHKDGYFYDVAFSASPLLDEDGKTVGTVIEVQDITERKQAEQALREQQRFTQSIVEAAPSLTYIYDITNSSTIFISPQSIPVLGYSTEEINAFGTKILPKLLHSDDVPLAAERFEKLTADVSDEIFELEYRMRRKDGEYVWLFDRARVFRRNMDGTPTQILGVATDITTRRQAEEQLRYQLQLTQNITETAAVAIFVSDHEGRITFLNPEAEKIFGYTIDELRGTVLHDAIHYKHPDGTPFLMSECPLGRVYQDGEAVRDYESTFFRKDGTPVSAISSNTPIIEHGEVTGEVMAMLDITPRKIEELNAQLLLRVSELIRETGSVNALFTDVVRLLGERLSVKRCLVNQIDLENDQVTVHSEYKTGSLRSYIGTLSTSSYSRTTRNLLEKGETIAVADTETDERTAEWFEKSYQPEGIGAYIACPLMRENRWTATLWLSSDEPREWHDWEIELVKTVGERAWLAAEKLRSEKQVRESEERFRLLTENLDNVFWILDWKTKRSEYVSRAFSQLYGDENAESLAVDFESWTTIIHEEDRERAKRDFLAIDVTGRYESTYRIVLPDGSIRWRHAKGSPIRDESGEILRVVGVTEDITDRKLAEMQILESEQRLRLATDVAEMFAWESDFTAQKITWSENAAKIIGCAPQELPTDTKDSMFFVLPEDHDRLLKNFEQVLLDGSNHYVMEFRGVNGQYWQAHGSIIRNEQGSTVKVVGVTQDITKRKRFEEKIQTANYRFRVAEEAAKGFNYEWNLETGIVTRSESIAHVLGYTREELATTWQAWADLIHPDDLTIKTEVEARKTLETSPEETFSGEYRVRHKEGHYVWLMERGLVIRDADGGIKRVIGQTMDISEQKRTQEKLLEAERRAVSDYRKLLSRIAPLAQTLGTARELTTIYRALLDFIRLEVPCEGFFVSSYDAENQLKQVKYVWSDGSEIDARAMQPIPLFKNNGANSRAIRDGKSIISTRDLEKMNGQFQIIGEKIERTVESLVTPMIVMGRVIGTLEVQSHEEKYGQEHVVALEMAANLAAVAIENVRLMNIESEARYVAEAANRAKDEFLAMLSHELRSPLNAMYGWTQILQTTNPDAEKTAKAIEVIARNVRLQKTLIEDLLDVSRIISGKMQLESENVSLSAIVQEAVEAARPAAEKQDLRIELEVSAETDEILGDKHRLQQVVGNLLTNAVKFTLPGGTIRIALENVAGVIKLTVADTGIGIAPDLLPRIFDRFLQADGGYKRKYGGLGLGLTIVKHLVELHGGSVVALSEGEGSGATFTVEFPLLSQPFYLSGKSADGDAQTLAQDTKKLEGARILAVDDDRDVLDLMNFVLKQQGAVVTCASSAREALERLRDETFDLMISDLGMAEMDGFDLIKKIREAENGSNRFLPAIALTGFVSAQDRKRVLESGFQNHLSKPVDLENLLKVVVGLIKDENKPRNPPAINVVQ